MSIQRWRQPVSGRRPPTWRGLRWRVQQSLAGKSNKVLSQAMTRQQLTAQMNDFGLGLGLSGSGLARTFGHNGGMEGFDALMLAFAETGQALVVMINANDNWGMMNRIVQAVARKYKVARSGRRLAPAATNAVAPNPSASKR